MGRIMAKPIELGLVLEGDDARDFHKYMENPMVCETTESLALLREAAERAKRSPL
jgi:hypothetical protein